MQSLAKGRLHFSLEDLQQFLVEKQTIIQVGNHCFDKLTKYGHQEKNELEKITKASCQNVKIQTILLKKNGVIILYTIPNASKFAHALFSSFITNARKSLNDATQEHPLLNGSSVI